MLNMDNNPVPASSTKVRFSAIRQAAMTRLAPGSEPRCPRARPGRRGRSGGELAPRSSWPRSGCGSRSCSWSAALVVGRWDVIRNYWDRLTRGTLTESIALSRRLGRYRVFLPDGPRRGLRLAGRVRDLQHGPGPPQAGRGPRAARRRRGADAAFAVPDSTGGNPDGTRAFRPLVREFESSGVVARAGRRRHGAARDTRAAGALDRRGPDRGRCLRGPAGPRPAGGPGASRASVVPPTAGSISAPRSPIDRSAARPSSPG